MESKNRDGLLVPGERALRITWLQSETDQWECQGKSSGGGPINPYSCVDSSADGKIKNKNCVVNCEKRLDS